MHTWGEAFRRRSFHTAVIATNVVLFSILWLNSLWIADDWKVPASSSYLVFNVRLAFWLYSVEVAIELFAVALSESEDAISPRQFIRTSTINTLVFIVNLAVRWLLVVGGTWVLLAIPSPFAFLPYLAAVLPTALWQVLRPFILNRSGAQESGRLIRGSKILSFDQARNRLAQKLAERSTREDAP